MNIQTTHYKGFTTFMVSFSDKEIDHTLSPESRMQLAAMKSPAEALKFLLEKVRSGPQTSEPRAHEEKPTQESEKRGILGGPYNDRCALG